MSKNVSDHIVEMLVVAGVKRVYAVTGDSLNPVNDAVRRDGRLQWIHVRHEEAGAYAASSQFWMTFGGDAPVLVAADGQNVVPVNRNKTFIAIAETYDFIVTIPKEGKIEFRATAEEGSFQNVLRTQA